MDLIGPATIPRQAGAPRKLPLLRPQRPREPLRQCGLHGLHDRWRLRRGDAGRCPVLLPGAGGVPGPAGRSAAVCRPDRVPLAATHRGPTTARPVRVRGRGAHHLPSRPLAGPTCLRLHPPRGRAEPGLRRLPGETRVGSSRWSDRRNQSTPRSSPRAGRRACSGRARFGGQGRDRRLRRHPHERDPAFPYDLLWGERSIRSVARKTRADGEEFMALAPQVPVHTEVEAFPLTAANKALARLRSGAVNGAVALSIAPTAPGNGSVRPSATAFRPVALGLLLVPFTPAQARARAALGRSGR